MTFPVWLPFENEWATFAIFMGGPILVVGLSNIALKVGLLFAAGSRRWVHFIVGVTSASTPFIFSSQVQPITLAVIFTILNGLTLNHALFRGIHSQSRKSFGTVLFPITYGLMVLLFWDYPELVVIALCVLAISDPLAAQVGQSTPRPSYFTIWEDEKTVQGTLSFFVSSFMIIYMGAQTFFDASNNYLFGMGLFTAIGATLAEVTSCKGSDNFSIPTVSILFMIGYMDHVNEQGQFFDLTVSLSTLPLIVVILLFALAYQFNSLSRSGFYGGLLMGIIITLTGGEFYLIPLAVFFILSSTLSQIIKNASFYRTKGSRRDIVQVYANGGFALILCLVDFLFPNPITFFLFLASVAGATADTWGTEFGKLSDKKPVSILDFTPTTHGISGGITRIGTIGSFLGSSVIGFTVWIFFPSSPIILYGIILSGFFASLFDSYLGAKWQAKFELPNGHIVEKLELDAKLVSGVAWLGNDWVNFFNTLFAAIVMTLFLQFV